MCAAIPDIYGKNYSHDGIVLGQKIFMVFMISTVLHMITDAFSGCIVGYEKFLVTSTLQLSRTLIKMILWFVLLKTGVGVLAIACVDLFISIITLLFSVGYAVLILHETPRLYYFDRKKFYEIISFGLAIFLQAIVNQVNNNVDTMILGAYVTDKAIITMYSSALTIYAIYNSLISVIANFFLPKATRLIHQNALGNELTDFVIAPGRFQAVIAVASILGFSLFGRNFICIWIGEKYLDAYWITLMLMIPVTIPLVENTMIAVLDASLKRIYRSVVLVIMAVMNAVISLWLVSAIGFWGAAIGTMISLVLGHGVMMNFYYAKTFHLQIVRMFYSIFKGILPAGIMTTLLCIPVSWLPNSISWFLIKCTIFIVIYGVFLLLIGLNSSEKKMISKALKIKFRKSS
jgi:O-antigen/teichoic acid export membrane protein